MEKRKEKKTTSGECLKRERERERVGCVVAVTRWPLLAFVWSSLFSG